MRSEIYQFRADAKHSNTNRRSLNEQQSDEVSRLIKAIEVSEIGQSELDSICDEADKLKTGLGSLLHSI